MQEEEEPVRASQKKARVGATLGVWKKRGLGNRWRDG